MLVLRDLVGVEPLGGVYRPLAGDRKARGLLRADAREDALPGYVSNDYLDDEAFWAQVEGAKDKALELAEPDPDAATSSTTPRAASVPPGATSGGCAG